ncbi:MAG: hypothetical protein PHN49_06445 [Candidatus Omnitrophica bacterium]|nr:hypothetical protein [Candidatus Omnitrophota bacterium]MDD5671258.1 hypothetical protein [Candidatus Omnitrophota bacterium]
MVQIYRKKWQRGIFKAFFGYVRDCLILMLPVEKIPAFIVKALYGIQADFAFMVHPRAYNDIFVSQPFLKPIKLVLRKKIAYRMLSKMPPFVLSTVKTKQNINGIVVGQMTIPETMFEERKVALRAAEKSLRLISKICKPKVVIGLGGWLPMISRRGVDLHKQAEKLGCVLTNGHCGTLASIYMTVERIAQIVGIPLSELSLAIIGVGKMGSNVAKAFNQKIKKITLIDINEISIRKTKSLLETICPHAQISILAFDRKNINAVKQSLTGCHIGVCATSTVRNLLRIKDLPLGFIAIDDSRPEALPRDPKNERIILEGGLLKIIDAQIDYDYGFGGSDDAFGCLGESFLLALDKGNLLNPTLGDVDLENFHRMVDFCRANGVREGDLRSSDSVISHRLIRDAFESRGFSIEKLVED